MGSEFDAQVEQLAKELRGMALQTCDESGSVFEGYRRIARHVMGLMFNVRVEAFKEARLKWFGLGWDRGADYMSREVQVILAYAKGDPKEDKIEGLDALKRDPGALRWKK